MKFKSERYLDYDRFHDFLILDESTFQGNLYFDEKFAPFFGNRSSVKLRDSTLYSIASMIEKADVDYKFKTILETTGEKRIFDLMGLLATYCCWTSYVM